MKRIIKGIIAFIAGGIVSPFYIIGVTIYHMTRMIFDKEYRKTSGQSWYSQFNDPNPNPNHLDKTNNNIYEGKN